jgi:hypothetical protein
MQDKVTDHVKRHSTMQGLAAFLAGVGVGSFAVWLAKHSREVHGSASGLGSILDRCERAATKLDQLANVNDRKLA